MSGVSYADFLERKTQSDGDFGFEPLALPDFLFDFQRALVEWALRKGRAALFCDCVAAGTLIDTECGPVPIEEMKRPMRVWSRTRSGQGTLTNASASWVNGYAPLYEYVTATGRRLRATGGHRFLTDQGWRRGEDLAVGARLLACDIVPLRSSLEPSPSAPRANDQRWMRTTSDSMAHCFDDHHVFDGGRLRSVASSVRASLPSQGGAHGCIRPLLRMDDLDDAAIRSHRHLPLGHRSMRDCDHPVVSAEVDGECLRRACNEACSDESSRTSLLVDEGSILGRRDCGSRPLVDEWCADDRCEPRFSFDTLVAVDYIGEDVFYDLYVPETSAYVANGLVAHNCGTGKAPMALVWAENVILKAKRPVLIATPLAVGAQMVREGEKFGIECAQSRDGSVMPWITVTNYERLHHFNPEDFAGLVADESSILKSFDGVRRQMVTDFMRKLPYRLLCTATAAPNDYVELGTSSEALGHLGHMDMLSRFFTNKDKTSKAIGGRWRSRGGDEWRFKGHAEDAFWRWVASWARAMRKPSDLGFDDGQFQLPPLEVREHVISARAPREDMLFDLPAQGLREERDESRRTIEERCEKSADLVREHDISILWCHLNAEGDRLEELVPNALQVKGSDASDYKELVAEWFTGRICVCDHPAFRAKLAAWRGNQNTQNVVASAIGRMHQNVNGDAPKDVHPKPTVNTCASTTQPMPNAGLDELLSNEQSTTVSDESGMRLIPDIESESNNRRGSVQAIDEPQDYAANMASRSNNGMPCSGSREMAVPSADPATDSKSITATHQATSVASSAPNVTSGSVSSPIRPQGSNKPHCICGHESGVRRLISKPVMFGYGLNFQHCAHMVLFPSHSYEQYYQAVRRCWRFGQANPVQVDIITTEGGTNALQNLQRKARQADRMFDALVACMNDALNIQRAENYDQEVTVPAWL